MLCYYSDVPEQQYEANVKEPEPYETGDLREEVVSHDGGVEQEAATEHD